MPAVLRAWLATALVFTGLDAFWLTAIAPKLDRPALDPVLSDGVQPASPVRRHFWYACAQPRMKNGLSLVCTGVQWRVDYLTEDGKVCHVKVISTSNRIEAAREVLSGLIAAERLYGASGYVVREAGKAFDPFEPG